MALLEAFGAPLPGLVPSKEAKALLARGALRHEKLCATLKHERIAPQLRAAKEQLSTCVDEPILNAVEASLSASRLGVANVLDEMVAASEPAVPRLGLELSRGLARRLTLLNDTVLELVQENEDMRERFGASRQEAFRLWEVD